MEKRPLLTWQGFLISFGIILVIYLVMSASLHTEQKDTSKRSATADNKYDYSVIDGDEKSDNSILTIPIEGMILTDRGGDAGIFNFLQDGGATYGYDVKKELERASKDDSIKAVMLEINSPGGTISGANAIAEGVSYYKKITHKPVYSHITDLGASGAYWSAISTDYIVSEIGGTVGSIGVIMGPFKYYNKVTSENSFTGGVQTDGGIDYTYITAGQYKDTGSPYRKMTDEEQKHWQTAINNEYDRFVSYVSLRRNIPKDTIINQIKALPYDTKRALELHLIDKEGSREVAMDMLAQKAGLTDYSIVQEDQSFGFIENIFSKVESLQPKKEAACSWCKQPLLLYDGSYSLLK